MSITHLLEDFATTDPAETATLLMSNLELEEQRLAAFERGYTEGWDDAIAADAQTRTRLTESLTQNLEDAVFSYHEAFAQMQHALIPVFDAIAEQLLPAMIEAGLPVRLAPALQEAASEAMSRPIVLSVPAGYSASIAPILPRGGPVEILVEEEASLSDGQARLHLDDRGFEIDLSTLAGEMRDALAAFAFETSKEMTRERSV